MRKILPIKTHVFNFNPKGNSGEALTIKTEFFDNGDDIYTNQEIILQSYCNSASINLYGVQLTPVKLRTLAEELQIISEELLRSTIIPKEKFNDVK